MCLIILATFFWSSVVHSMLRAILWLCISEVIASNRISWVESSLNITVMLPFPQNLSVSVVMEPDELPWCHPDVSSEHHVYSNVPVEFEAYLLINANLTFHWQVVENMSSQTVDEVTVAGVRCFHGQSCTSSVQVCMLLVLCTVGLCDTLTGSSSHYQVLG